VTVTCDDQQGRRLRCKLLQSCRESLTTRSREPVCTVDGKKAQDYCVAMVIEAVQFFGGGGHFEMPE